MIADDGQWRVPSPDLQLSDNAIHVWRISLEQPMGRVQLLSELLSQDELARAAHFHFERDRRCFIIGRGILRILLGRYVGANPRDLQFHYGLHGKPYLATEFNRSRLRFSLAHSNELAVYACSFGREVGIDVEFIHPLPDAEGVAASFFSAYENIALRTLPESQRLEAFFNCWTRKEAYLKALGDGLSHPLDKFQVSLLPDEPARLVNVEGLPEEVARWSMVSFMSASGYPTALVIEGSGYHLDYWHGSLENGSTISMDLNKSLDSR